MTFGHFCVRLRSPCLQVIVSFVSFQVMSCFLLQFDTCLFWAWPRWLLACRLCYSCHAVIQSFTVLPPLWYEWMNETNSLILSQLWQSVNSYFWGFLHCWCWRESVVTTLWSSDGSMTSVLWLKCGWLINWNTWKCVVPVVNCSNELSVPAAGQALTLCSVCLDKSFSKGAMWWTHLVGQRGLQTAAPKLHKPAPVGAKSQFCPLKATAIYNNLSVSVPRSCQLFFCFATAARTRIQISKSWDNTGEHWGLVKGRTCRLKYVWVPCFLRHTACLSGLQRAPSWFSSVQTVITLAGWLPYSMCISQHFQCFLCVVPIVFW